MPTTGNFGTAELRTEADSDLSLCFERASGFDGVNGFILGENKYLPDEVGLFWNPARNRGMALTVGGSRKGKGASTLIPALLSYGGSCIALDIKGELAWITANRRRELGQRVVILDPFDEVNRSFGRLAGERETTTRFNPLASLDPSALSFSDDISGVVEALIWQQGNADPFFVGASRELVSGIIAAEVQQNPGYASLPNVRDWLNLDEDELAERCRQVCELPEMKGTLAERKLKSFGKVTKTYSAVIATCKEQLAFLDSEEMRRFLVTDDEPFDFSLLSSQKVSVYLVLAGTHLETHARFLRLCISQAVRHVIRVRPELNLPITFFLDEMGTSLGPMPILERAWGVASGYGMVLWGFIQDLTQLKRDYPQSWETFISNSTMIQVVGCRDSFTSNYFSEYLGKATIEVLQTSASRSVSFGDNAGTSAGTGSSFGSSHSTSHSSSPQGGSSSTSFGTNSSTSFNSGWSKGTSKTASYSESINRSEIGKPLLDPDQLRRIPLDQTLVIIPGELPYQLMRLEYFSDPRFYGLYRFDPHYPAPLPAGSRSPKLRDPTVVAAEEAAEAARLRAEAERQRRLEAELHAQRIGAQRLLEAQQAEERRRREAIARAEAEKLEKRRIRRLVWVSIVWLVYAWLLSGRILYNHAIYTPIPVRLAAYILLSVALVMVMRTAVVRTIVAFGAILVGCLFLQEPLRLWAAWNSTTEARGELQQIHHDLDQVPQAPPDLTAIVAAYAAAEGQKAPPLGKVTYSSTLYNMAITTQSPRQMTMLGFESCKYGTNSPRWRNVAFTLARESSQNPWKVQTMKAGPFSASKDELLIFDSRNPEKAKQDIVPVP